jgi:hypothetical protein
VLPCQCNERVEKIGKARVREKFSYREFSIEIAMRFG